MHTAVWEIWVNRLWVYLSSDELQAAALGEALLERLSGQAKELRRALHDGLVGRRLAPQEQRGADHALAPDHRELGALAALRHVKQRDDALHREVHVLDARARVVHDAAELQAHRLELRTKARELLDR